MTFTRSRGLAGITVAAWLTACASESGGSGNGGAAGAKSASAASTTASIGGAGGAQTTSTASGGASVTTCDDLGFCGQAMDPGCVTCAMTASCAESTDACKAAEADACLDLLDCYRDCKDDDTMCFDDCDAKFPTGVGPLSILLHCVFCDECPVSCNIKASSC